MRIFAVVILTLVTTSVFLADIGGVGGVFAVLLLRARLFADL